jgi:hypothetical protein
MIRRKVPGLMAFHLPGRWAWLAACVLVLGPCATAAQAQGIHSLEALDRSCEAWTANAAYDVDVDNWLIGFWSGLNTGEGRAARRVLVSESDNPRSLIAEVRHNCEADPALSILHAALAVFRTYARERTS